MRSNSIAKRILVLTLTMLVLQACDELQPEVIIIEGEYPNPDEEAATILNAVLDEFEFIFENEKQATFDLSELSFEDSAMVDRKGVVEFKLLNGANIEEAGAVFEICFYGTRSTDKEFDKFIELEGTKTYINETGGSITKPSNPIGTVVFSRLRSFNFKIFYSGSKGPITTNTARRKRVQRVQVGQNVEFNSIVYGDTTLNGQPNLKDWGTMRNGFTEFQNIIVQPVQRNFCTDRAINVNGVLLRKIGEEEKVVLYGVDEQGVPVHDCSAFGQLVITTDSEGNTSSEVISYD